MELTSTRVRCILTRSSGYLAGVSSHSLQPYRGCSYGRSLCGVGCYVRHNPWVTRGREWGSFLEVRVNAAESYSAVAARERSWAREHRGSFSVFMSSATDPFVPQERRLGITASVLESMILHPPDELILQTHSPTVAGARVLLERLSEKARVRVQISIESDRNEIEGLPKPASSVEARLDALASLRDAGLRTVACVSPLLPIAQPDAFFRRIAASADAVIVDHFIGGDGSKGGARTRRTPLPAAMASLEAGSDEVDYLERIVRVARSVMPGRVGVSRDGFAGRFS